MPEPPEKLTLLDLSSYAFQVAKGMEYLAAKKVSKRSAFINVLCFLMKPFKLTRSNNLDC